MLIRMLLCLTAMLCVGGCREDVPEPETSDHIYSPEEKSMVFSKREGNSCFLYRVEIEGKKATRLTDRKSGCESDPSFSHDGKKVTYSLSASGKQGSSLWVTNLDGTDDHAVLAKAEDDFAPVFSKDDRKLYFLRSGRFGNSSPFVRPARHDIDIFTVSLESSEVSHLTQQHLYAVKSLSLSPDGETLLISTSRYPIGDLIEEYKIARPTGPHGVHQPHVSGEPSPGPALGDAFYSSDGMEILFLGASNASGGNYDYNVYRMSAVTGSDLQQITTLKGMADNLRVSPGGKHAIFSSGTDVLVVDLQTRKVEPLSIPK